MAMRIKKECKKMRTVILKTYENNNPNNKKRQL